MGVIDFRVRPMIGGYQNMATNGTCDKFLTAFRCAAPASVLEKSVDLLVREMDEAGVDLAVVPGRQSPKTVVTNEQLLELTRTYPGRFEVFPLYDPLRPEESLKEIKDLVLHGPCKGVSTEPGFGNTLRFDDEAYRPLYRFLDGEGLPMLTTFSGSITPSMDATLPGRFHAVAKEFPGITMIAGHAGWPWLRELCCAAFFTPNIYLIPDLYAYHCPGEEDARTAADYMLRDRMLFGSAYPLLPVGDAVAHAKGWGLHEDAARRYFHDNAAQILGL